MFVMVVGVAVVKMMETAILQRVAVHNARK